MRDICRPIKKKDHDTKIEGRSRYLADYDLTDDGKEILCGKLLRSKYAKAKILGVTLPELPEGYMYVDASDVPGDNNVNIVLDDMPVYAREVVEFIGEPIGMVVGPDEAEVNRILSEIKVNYEVLEPITDLLSSDTDFFHYEFGHGDIEKAFSEADRVFEEEFRTGYQEQAYLEVQGMMAEPEQSGRMYVHGSLQCPYYVHGAVARALGTGPDGVHIYQDVTGGGFGGKEDYPSILGCQVAVAAHKAKAPVRCVLERREDMETTSKRHPSVCRYKMALKDGRITAVDCEVIFDAGAYSSLSAVVLQRGIIAAPGVYNIPNVHVVGRAAKTNTVPCGAYRGFGAPQTFFAVEMMMSHIAQSVGEDSVEFKRRHLAKQGDMTSTAGRYHFPVPLPDMIDEVDGMSDFCRKHKEYAQPQSGRYRRGVGFSNVFHGAGFTGSGERDLIKAVAKLRKYKDGTVEVLASNSDIGQGVRTTFPKIVAHELNIPVEKVFYEHPDTGRVPDSGPTVASRSLMTVGELLRRAAIKLRDIWKDGEEQEVEEHYKEPDFMIPFYLDRFEGDAYPTYAWSVNAVEVEVDTYTGLAKILGAYASFDVGTPIDYNIVLGQMEGGFLQGLGYASIEKMDYDKNGKIWNRSFTDYLVPTAVDVPNMQVDLHVEEYPDGPYGAKGAGELPLVGAAPAYAEAVEQALGGFNERPIRHVPFNAEDVIAALEVK